MDRQRGTGRRSRSCATSSHVLPVRPGTEDLPLEELLAAQAYRLAFWRVADEELNYRRFFDVDTLVGLRVEDPAVFDATHAMVVRLVREGWSSGLRVDHPDGLADPAGYLRRLAAGARRLLAGRGEDPSGRRGAAADWQCDGTTGYDALAALTGVFVDPAGEPVLTSGVRAARGRRRDAGRRRPGPSRRDVLRGPLVTRSRPARRGRHQVCQAELRLRDHSLRGLTEGLLELLTTMPVYRAYVVPGQPADSQAHQWMEQASALACEHLPERASEIDRATGSGARETRSQPAQGRVLRAFPADVRAGDGQGGRGHRRLPLVPAHVAGRGRRSPRPVRRTPAGPALVRDRTGWRTWPQAMNALSTHDTKRSEDVRARLAGLSEVGAQWRGRGARAAGLRGRARRTRGSSGSCGRPPSARGRSTPSG